MTVANILKITPKAYQKMVVNLFFDWLSTYEVSPNRLQLMLLDSGLRNYFNTHLNVIEKDFLNIVSNSYTRLCSEDLRQFYIASITKLYTAYPQALLKSIKVKPIQKSYN